MRFARTKKIRPDSRFERIYRHRGKDEFVERSTRPSKTSLEAATSLGLLVLIVGRTRLISSRPRGADEVRDPCTALLGPRQQARAGALSDLLDLRGGGLAALPGASCSCGAWRVGLTAGAASSTEGT
jgi:hypothetical protein